MITVDLCCPSDGTFLACRARGHAGWGKKGRDIVCAAVSVLLRTEAAVLRGIEGISVISDAPYRGAFSFRAESRSGRPNQMLCFAGDFLREGLFSLEAEYPECIAVCEIPAAAGFTD